MNTESISRNLLETGYFAHLELAAGATRTDRWIAVARLREAGHRCIAENGFTAFEQELALEPAAAAIEWHFGDSPGPWPEAARQQPDLLPPVWSHLQREGTHRLLLSIEPGLTWFRGHFPEQPILAGVVQLHWAGLLTQQLFGFTGMPGSVSRLKFQHLVIPPAVLDLMLTPISPRLVHFKYTSRGRVHSQGRLNFERPDS